MRFDISEEDRIFALSSLSFDLSVFDVFGALAAGASIVIPDRHATRDPADWLEMIRVHRVTVWNSVPALLSMLVEYASSKRMSLQNLRLAMLSGDWIPLTLPDRFRALVPQAKVISLGGATEASIWSITYPIDHVQSHWKSIPYGTPLRNQRLYVLDSVLSPRPVWATGHLYIGGIGLAKGYWRDKEKTDASFIRHPKTGERIYKTGDLGRYLPDGGIEFLGREDCQVKVQGYRIELGEIEAVLEAQPDVANAVVAVTGEKHAEKCLIAYVVTRTKKARNEEALRTALAAKLPQYMAPAIFMFLNILPLSPNGKVNRAALPAPVWSRSQVLTSRPNERIDKRISQIVEDILDVGNIAPDANLFHFGLTSLEVIRISNALSVALNFHPGMEEIFSHPTIHKLTEAYWRHAGKDIVYSQGGSYGIASTEQYTLSLIEEPQERKAFKERQMGIRTFATLPKLTSLHKENDHIHEQHFKRYQSVRKFCDTPIRAIAFSGFLRCLFEETVSGSPKYLYPSAGGLYPVQIYIYVKSSRVEGIAQGTYYYHPKHHTLMSLREDANIPAGIYDHFVNRPIFEGAAFSLFFIAEMAAIEPMYGEHSLNFCHIEAGAISQLLIASAATHDLGLCMVGALDFDTIRPLFALDRSHRLILSMLGGKRLLNHEQISPPGHNEYSVTASIHNTDGREQGVI